MTIRLRKEKHPKGCYDTEFSFDDSKKTFNLSDADLDSEAGDLEEWCVVSYLEIPKIIQILNSLYGKIYIDYTDEQIEFLSLIENDDVKKLFPYIVSYCTKQNGNMRSFEKLLKENNVDFLHSAYRSGSW